jgi:O-antigen/teichoic acid export membrane protein
MTTGQGLMPVLTRALGWNYVSGIVLLLGQLAYTAVTARKIPPDAFGAYAVALTFIQVTSYFGGATLGNALMRAPEADRRTAGTALTMALGVGVGLSGLLVAAAAPAGALLHMPQLRTALYYLAWLPPLTGGSVVCSGILRRNDRFRAAAVIDASTSLLGFLVGGVLAVSGAGVGALATAQLVSAGGGLILGAITGWRWLSFTHSASARRDLLPFALNVSGQNLVHYIVAGLPMWFVASVAGPTATGYYSRALQLVSLPAYQLLTGIQRSLYPMYNRLAADAERLRRALTDVIVVTDGVSCLFFGLGAACGPPAAALLLGPEWKPAIQLFPLFCAVFAAQTVYAVTASAAEALGWMRLLWSVQAMLVVTTFAGLWGVGAQHLTSVVVVIFITTLASHVAMLVAPKTRSWLNGSMVIQAYVVHAAVGVALYLVATTAANVANPSTAVRELVVRSLATSAALVVLFSFRRRLPAYQALARRRRDRTEHAPANSLGRS